MKIIWFYDNFDDNNDLKAIVNDRVYEKLKLFLVQYHLKHPKDVEFISGGEE